MKYELMLVASTRGNSDSVVSRIEKIIKDNQAESVKVESMGKKPLAYSIKKHQEANFYLINFDAPEAAIAPVVQKLRLEQEEVLRYMIIKTKFLKPSKKKKGMQTEAIEAKPEPKVRVAVKTAKVEKEPATKTTKPKTAKTNKVTKAAKAPKPKPKAAKGGKK